MNRRRFFGWLGWLGAGGLLLGLARKEQGLTVDNTVGVKQFTMNDDKFDEYRAKVFQAAEVRTSQPAYWSLGAGLTGSEFVVPKTGEWVRVSCQTAQGRFDPDDYVCIRQLNAKTNRVDTIWLKIVMTAYNPDDSYKEWMLEAVDDKFAGRVIRAETVMVSFEFAMPGESWVTLKHL